MTWDRFRFYFLICALLYAASATVLNLFLTLVTGVARSDGWRGFLYRTIGYFIVTAIMLFCVIRYK